MDKKARKERLNRVLNNDNPNIISGVHNYCDRWCERCKYIKRCRVGLMELARMEDGDDIEGDDLWLELSAMFEATFEMIAKDAKKFGIDLNDISTENVREKKTELNDIEKKAKSYSRSAHKWLEENNECFQKMQNVEFENDPFSIPDFFEALEVIRYYLFFIEVKTRRAFFDIEEIADEDPIQNDNNGTAKIAIIAIDRSIEAYTVLFYRFKDHEEQILKYLKQLANLKEDLISVFPYVMKFVRPGFDTE